jgi:malonyl CoA-acyl carrier protein transacylase
MTSIEAGAGAGASSTGGLPMAQVIHHLRHRVRLRIEAGRRRGADYDHLATTLKKRLPEVNVRCNPVTGSVVVSGPPAAIETVGTAAEKAGLFRLQAPPPLPRWRFR